MDQEGLVDKVGDGHVVHSQMPIITPVQVSIVGPMQDSKDYQDEMKHVLKSRMFQWLFQNMVSFVDLVTEHIKCKDEPEMGICSKGNLKKSFSRLSNDYK